MSRFVLKPSALSKQASKLEYYATDDAGSAKKPRLDTDKDPEETDEKSKSEEKRNESENQNPKTGEMVKLPAAPVFMPDAPVVLPPSATPSQFIFGTNVRDRVVGVDLNAEDASKEDDSENNGLNNGEKRAEEPELSNNGESGGEEGAKSLSESAAEYERRRDEAQGEQRRLLYSEVVVTTGEEGEKNVLHLSCKLYAFDAADHNWVERGRGELHLNDDVVDDDGDGEPGKGGGGMSRIVIRTQGSLRVVLNSRVFPEMTARRVREKTVEFTAVADDAVVKIFLVQLSNAHDAELLHRSLEERIRRLRGTTTTTTTKAVAARSTREERDEEEAAAVAAADIVEGEEENESRKEETAL